MYIGLFIVVNGFLADIKSHGANGTLLSKL